VTLKQQLINSVGDDGQFYTAKELADITGLKPASVRVVVKQMSCDGLQLIETRLIDGAVKYRFHKESVNSRANSLFRLVVFGEAIG
jgi:hypothetical protein